MPRYYRRRYTRVVRPKKKWASNITPMYHTFAPLTSPQFYDSLPLVTNSTQITTPTPTVIKTGNFKVQMDFTYILNGGASVEISAFIMYIPEGTEPTSYSSAKALVEKHPEWVMGWKYASLDYAAPNVQSGTETMNFSTRLKRNLNSGDSVSLVLLATTSTGGVNITAFQYGGMAQYWTCAN